ncbi:MAG: hypothetical protein K2Y29_13715 [Beijerinckiaceae bacterium]|nr:hypothetical protein [Beijerinckiaceae bacterium]
MTVEFSSKSPAIAILPTRAADRSSAQQPVERPESVELAFNAVSRAANAIEELVTYGQNISDISERGIAHYRGAANAAIARAEALEQECSDLRQDLSSTRDTLSARVLELEAEVAALNDELEKMRSLLWPDRNL